MAGLIYGALAGLGSGLSDLGTILAKSAEKDEDREYRRELERQRAQDRADLQAERLAARQELQADRLAARGAGSGGTSGRIDFNSPEGQAIAAQALSEDGTLTDGQRYLKALVSGDLSGMESVIPAREGNNPSAYTPETTAVTEQTKELLKLKGKKLLELREAFAFGPSYDDVQKGRRAGIENEVAGRVASGKDLSDAERLAVLEGKPLYKGGASGATNTITGEQDLNALGKAQAAKAARAPAGGGKTSVDKTEDQITRKIAENGKEIGRLLTAQKNQNSDERVRSQARIDALTSENDDLKSKSKFASKPAAAASAPAASRGFKLLGRE